MRPRADYRTGKYLVILADDSVSINHHVGAYPAPVSYGNVGSDDRVRSYHNVGIYLGVFVHDGGRMNLPPSPVSIAEALVAHGADWYSPAGQPVPLSLRGIPRCGQRRA